MESLRSNFPLGQTAKKKKKEAELRFGLCTTTARRPWVFRNGFMKEVGLEMDLEKWGGLGRWRGFQK